MYVVLAVVLSLTGPWRFAIGDDATRAAPSFDDSHWELVDLTPATGAHDGDVGYTGYVPGWFARGHAGYVGFAWYRLRIATPADAWIAAPNVVDSAYQLFCDGQLLGGQGNFESSPPSARYVHPRAFALPPGDAHVIALRVWLDPLDAGDGAGGVHVAPSIGSRAEIAAIEHAQRTTLFEGYVVDAALAAVLFALALVALIRGRHWLSAALVAIALMRFNQITTCWLQLESPRAYDIVRNTVLAPITLALWTITWNRSRWIAVLAIGLAIALAATRIDALRWGFVALYACAVVTGERRSAWIAALVAIGLFAEELGVLHVPGIWFPFGIGVSRTQLAYAALVVALSIKMAGDGARRARDRPARS